MAWTGPDRTRPLWRCFRLDDGSLSWWTVELHGAPGRAATPDEVDFLTALIMEVDWEADFRAALNKHNKATLYANL